MNWVIKIGNRPCLFFDQLIDLIFLFNIGGNWGGVIKAVIGKRLNQQVQSRHNQFERGGEVLRMHVTYL